MDGKILLWCKAMGLRDLFTPKPTINEFAQLLKQAMCDLQPNLHLSVDIESQMIIVQSTHGKVDTHFLGNIFQEYRSASVKNRRELLRNYATSLILESQRIIEWKSAQPLLRPYVRPRQYFDIVNLQARLTRQLELVDSLEHTPCVSIGAHLLCGVACDLDRTISLVMKHDLKNWGLGFGDALRIATENLLKISNQMFVEISPGLYMSSWQDHFDASRLLLVDSLSSLALRGDRIAIIPTRDHLLVSGSQDDAALIRMAQVAEELLNEPHAISGFALRFDGQTWSDFDTRPGIPGHSALSRLKAIWWSQISNNQKSLLDLIHKRGGGVDFVASVTANQGKKSGEYFTRCIWTNGVQTLLPKTDRIMLLRSSGNSSFEMAAEVDWYQFQRVAGHLMEPLGMYPERFRVMQFPEADVLKRLNTQCED